jgi:hypothetical protein
LRTPWSPTPAHSVLLAQEAVIVKRRIPEVVQTLDRAGLHNIAIEVSRQLKDPVDERELEAFLQRYGVTRDFLVSLMGGSP